MIVCTHFIKQVIFVINDLFLKCQYRVSIVVFSYLQFIAVYAPLENRNLETNHNPLAIIRFPISLRQTFRILVQPITDIDIRIEAIA